MSDELAKYLPSICPYCGDSLRELVKCGHCGAQFSRLGRVPILATGVEVEPLPAPFEAFITDVARLLPDGGSSTARAELRAIFSARVSFGSLALQVEADQFIDRLRSSGLSISPPREELAPGSKVFSVNQDVNLRVTLGITPPMVRSGKLFAVQVRVANVGESRCESSGRKPVMLGYHHTDSRRERVEGRRTPFLMDLDPGATMTMPVLIEAPTSPGVYEITVTPLQEHVRWLLDASVSFAVEVTKTHKDPLAVPWDRGNVTRSYVDDHVHGVATLRSWLELSGVQDPRILELGGNANPMVKPLPGVKVNVDVDVFGLAFGELSQRETGRGNVLFLAADGMNLPFPDQTFDCIALFATFHHFPDPVGLLRSLATKLKPGAFIALMCEPLGTVTRDNMPDEFRAELLKGVNEQSFEPWEYREMLRAAGLEVWQALLDVGSAKIAARRPR